MKTKAKNQKKIKIIFLLMFCLCDLAQADYINQAIESIKNHEGFRSEPYLCTSGYLTIGYGFRVDNIDKKYRSRISNEESHLVLKSLIKNYVLILESWLGKDRFESLSKNQKIVFLDMTYNLGNKIKNFKKLKQAIEEQNIDNIKKEMRSSLWCKQVKTRCSNLINLI